MATFGRFAGRLAQGAASAVRSQAGQRLMNEAGEWAAGQVAGTVIDASTNANKAGYLQSAATGKPGSALFNIAADTLFDMAKQKMTSTPATPAAAVVPAAAPPQVQPSVISQHMSSILSAAPPVQAFNLPNSSFRDRAFNLSSMTAAQQSPLMSRAFDVTSVLSAGSSPQKSMLQMFAQKAAASDKKEDKAQVGAGNSNKENAAKGNEAQAETTPTTPRAGK